MKKFDPEKAFYLISKHGIRNAFMPPIALKLMRQVQNPQNRYDYNMRTMICGGGTLGEELLDWGKGVFGLDIHEVYGQTEVHLVAGNCSEVMEIKPGSMGRTCPGHTFEVIDGSGNVLPPGELGELAVQRPDPVMFLEYWRDQKATDEKFIGDWCLTGDVGTKDEDGYFWFRARKDDIIKSSGYRIGPSEVEDCILKHESVKLVGVVGSPDEVKGSIVKAFIVLREGFSPDDSLKADVQNFVKTKLAAYQYPREIEFVDNLPMTPSGKIKRKELQELEKSKKDKLHSGDNDPLIT
jgi:acetyl-CoA synthetase